MRRALIALLVAAAAACSPIIRPTIAGDPAPGLMAELWQEPQDLESRDLFHGPGGRELAPPPRAVWRYKSTDAAGYSPGYDVLDAEGREWDVKMGPEAQSEVAASRIFWAVGYHQPPTYLVASWRIAGAPGVEDDRPQPSARFRPGVAGMDTHGGWSWHQNPFVGTRPYRGLLVLNMIVNNWDLKATNNKVYQRRGPDDPEGPFHEKTVDPRGSFGESARRWFVVRDLGASFGRFRRFPYGTRNNVTDFERQRFIESVSNGRVRFAYHGRHGELLEHVTPEDVVWICERLARLTDRQWDDAFRAAAYPDTVKARLIATLRRKIGEGLALTGSARRAKRAVALRQTQGHPERSRGVVAVGAPTQGKE